MISGRNNVGKSTVLEAIFFNAYQVSDAFLRLKKTRQLMINEITPADLWGEYFTNRNTKETIRINQEDEINSISMIMREMEDENAIILIDEIENGFHYSIYSKVWEILAQAAMERNVQLIVTSHSYECIQGALEG